MEWIWNVASAGLKLLAPPLLSIVLGSVVIQRYFVRRSNQAQFIDSITAELKELRTLTLEYWVLEGDDKKNQPRLIALSQHIKASIRSISSDISGFCSQYRLAQDKSDQLKELVTAVHDACTSGDFESAKKPVDPGRCLAVANAINQLKSALRQQKL